MLIRKRSGLTGAMHSMELPVTQAQIDEFQTPGGRFVQDIFPDLHASQREFLLTGITPEEWDQYIGPNSEDPDDDDDEELSDASLLHDRIEESSGDR